MDNLMKPECDKFSIPWGMPCPVRDLSQDEVDRLKVRLTKLAAESNVISADFWPSELKWIRENVKDLHIRELSDDSDDGRTWAIIAITDYALKKYVNKI